MQLIEHANEQRLSLVQLLARIESIEQVHREERERDRNAIAARDLEIKLLTEQVRLLKAQKFGASSERYSPDQLKLMLNEAESLAAGVPVSATPASVVIPEHTRKARGHRKALPEHLPQVEVIHDLPEEAKVCPHDGATLQVIGEDISKQLDYVPAKVQVLKHRRLKYACPYCDGTIKVAAAAPQILPRSNASPGLLAHIVTAKYVDGLPLYRQEAQFERLGITLPRVTSARWMIELAEKLIPLMNLLNEHVLAQPLIHLDETPVQVLKSQKAPQSDHYMWVRCAGPPGKRSVLFEYDPSRGKAVPQRLLDEYGTEKYPGCMLTDGYEVYAALAKDRPQLVHAGCFAHLRRMFDAARKAAQHASLDRIQADEMLALIRQLYAIERVLKERGADAAERLRVRKEQSAPIVANIKQWTETYRPRVLPQSLLGKAIAYTQNQWHKLIVFLEHAHIPLDNNRAENAIRPFVIGRKAWLFCDTQAGANASATFYSLIETAKANHLEPHAYLTRLFTELPKAQSLTDIEALLPFKPH